MSGRRAQEQIFELTHGVGSHESARTHDVRSRLDGRRGVLRAVARSPSGTQPDTLFRTPSEGDREGERLQGRARELQEECKTEWMRQEIRQNLHTGLEELVGTDRMGKRGRSSKMSLRPSNVNMPVYTAEMLEQGDAASPHLAQALQEGRRDREAKQVKHPQRTTQP